MQRRFKILWKRHCSVTNIYMEFKVENANKIIIYETRFETVVPEFGLFKTAQHLTTLTLVAGYSRGEKIWI